MNDIAQPGLGDGPQGPPPIAPEKSCSASTKSRASLAERIESLLAPGPDGAASPERLVLHQALAARFGPAFKGAHLDREAIGAVIDRQIAEIDAALSRQVNAILHAPAVQALEARWRGLLYLAQAAYDCDRAKIKMLTATWPEVVRDLERAADFDQSALFRKIYTEEFGMPGGEPYGLIIADYQVQHRPSEGHTTDDIGALKSLSMVGGAAFCPIILGVTPRMFQLDSFRELGRPKSLQTVFAQTEYSRWRALRDGDDMRFIGAVLPRVLLRAPYGPDARRRDGFCFTEEVHDPSGRSYLWGNAAFAFGSIAVRAFASWGWFADLRGAPQDEIRGGLVTDLTVTSFATDRPGIATKPSIEYQLSETQERELTELGFMPVRKSPYSDYSVFYVNPSLQRPARYDDLVTDVNSRLSSMLQYTLCVSRFAHYIKVLGRDRIGSTMTADQCQDFLNKWLVNYCEGSDSASSEVKARYPLREGSVQVREAPGRPGSYACTVFLRPHYQLDDIATGFRLITELSPKLAAA